MEFKTEAQKACYQKVFRWMKQLFGTAFTSAREDTPLISVRIGSASAGAYVAPWGDNDTTINVRSWVVTGAEQTPELMKYLLTENNDMRFGAFGMDGEGDIFFDHTIIGSTCSKNELKASVVAVINVADEYDDKIIAKWGGQRFMDR